jgi:hypothetical protein
MRVTGEPQYVSVGRPATDAQGNSSRREHVLIAYRMQENALWVADPNYPGQVDRTIRFENGRFLPYNSGANAKEIATNGTQEYTDIRFMAKSALVNWAAIGSAYERMLNGTVGQAHFPPYVLSYASGIDPASGIRVWTELSGVLELNEAATAQLGEPYRGKLVVGIGMTQPFAAGWYNGTTQGGVASSDAAYRAILEIPLTPGALDLGIWIENLEGNQYYYNDFRRVKVIYEQP